MGHTMGAVAMLCAVYIHCVKNGPKAVFGGENSVSLNSTTFWEKKNIRRGPLTDSFSDWVFEPFPNEVVKNTKVCVAFQY